MAELNNHGVESFRRLWYGAVPELKATKELEVMSLDEVRASIKMVQQFKSLLLSLVKCEDSRALVQQAYNRFSDVLYGKAMELAMAEDRKRASITKAAGIGRLLLRVRSFLLPRRRRQERIDGVFSELLPDGLAEFESQLAYQSRIMREDRIMRF